MVEARDGTPGVPERVSAGGDAYVAGRDIHIHQEAAGGVPFRDEKGLDQSLIRQFLARPPAIWHVPFPRNPGFIGRDDELAALRSRLTQAEALPQVIHGLGGVGKTQLAVEYAYLYAPDYDLVWWLPTEQPTLVIASLENLAAHLGIEVSGRAEVSAAAAVEALRRRAAATRWLIIADNAVSSKDLRELAAAAGGGGHLLITSRNPQWSGVATATELDVLRRPDAVVLLRGHLSGVRAAEADRLADVLGDLPLALEQAGAWLAASAMTMDAYLDLIEHRTSQIMAQGTSTGCPVPLAATWTVTAGNLQDPTAVALMSLLAFFGPEPIPADLLADEAVADVSRELAAITQDPIARGRMITQLSRLGLVRVTGDGLVIVHRLVQAILRDYTPEAQRENFRRTVHRLLAAGDPAQPSDPATWPRYAQLLSHAQQAALASSDIPACKLLVLRLAWYLNARGDYLNGATLIRSALSTWVDALGEDHPDTIMAAANLAFALRAQGNDAAAREIFRDVLARSRRVIGEDHPDTISIEHNFASTLHAQGDQQAAIEMFRDVVARSRRVLGTDHPDTILASASLGFMMTAASDDETAQAICNHCQQILGEDHPAAIAIAASRALTLQAQGNHSAARPVLDGLLSRSRRVFGENHPVTIVITAYLAAGPKSGPVLKRKAVPGHSSGANPATANKDDLASRETVDLRYHTKDGVNFGFSFENINGWRIYVTERPSDDDRDTNSAHLMSDGKRYFVCWTAPLLTLDQAKSVATTWAEMYETPTANPTRRRRRRRLV